MSEAPTDRPKLSAASKAQKASPWVAFAVAIPALITALQSYSDSNAARQDSKDVSARGYERDDNTWRYTRDILDDHEQDIGECFEQLDMLSLSFSELYDHVHAPRGRNGSRNVARGPASAPEDLPMQIRAGVSRSKKDALPKDLGDLLKTK